MIDQPKKTAAIPKKTLKDEYPANLIHSLFCKSMKASFEKEENVVNPPHIPTVRNTLHSCDIKPPFSVIPKRIPIRKLPEIFTRNVPQGKDDK